MANKSNAFGEARFDDWTDWEIDQFMKLAKKYFGSEHFSYYIDFEDQISNKLFKVHGEGKWHIKSTLYGLKESLLDRRLTKDELSFISLMQRMNLTIDFTWIDEEGGIEWLETSTGKLQSLGDTLEYTAFNEKWYDYSRTNLRKFDLYDEFEVDEDIYIKNVIKRHPDLAPQIIASITNVIDHNPHASESQLDKLVNETLESFNLN